MNNKLLEGFTITEYREGVSLLESLKTKNIYYIVDGSGYDTVYINFNPVTKKAIFVEKGYKPEVRRVISEDLQEWLTNLDDSNEQPKKEIPNSNGSVADDSKQE